MATASVASTVTSPPNSWAVASLARPLATTWAAVGVMVSAVSSALRVTTAPSSSWACRAAMRLGSSLTVAATVGPPTAGVGMVAGPPRTGASGFGTGTDGRLGTICRASVSGAACVTRVPTAVLRPSKTGCRTASRPRERSEPREASATSLEPAFAPDARVTDTRCVPTPRPRPSGLSGTSRIEACCGPGVLRSAVRTRPSGASSGDSGLSVTRLPPARKLLVCETSPAPDFPTPCPRVPSSVSCTGFGRPGTAAGSVSTRSTTPVLVVAVYCTGSAADAAGAAASPAPATRDSAVATVAVRRARRVGVCVMRSLPEQSAFEEQDAGGRRRSPPAGAGVVSAYPGRSLSRDRHGAVSARSTAPWARAAGRGSGARGPPPWP